MTTSVTADFVPIDDPYLLAINIPLHRSESGDWWAEPMWAKDLALHTRYLNALTLACPVEPGEAPAGFVRLADVMDMRRCRIVALPFAKGRLGALLRLGSTMHTLWRLSRQAAIIHAPVAGWPIPYGWMLTPIVRLQRKPMLTVIESAFWRYHPEEARTLKKSAEAWLSERMARLCVRSSKLVIATQPGYLTSLVNPASNIATAVINASWINESDLIDRGALSRLSHHPATPSQPEGRLKLAFFGRLREEKGLSLLLSAMNRLAEGKQAVDLEIYGEGPLQTACVMAGAQSEGSSVSIRYGGTLAYGLALFERLRGFHAIVVPSLSDEQPRIVYDAYSQGTPVIASSTPGLQACVEDGVTGFLFKPGSPEALVQAVGRLVAGAQDFDDLRTRCRNHATTRTHEAMHRMRSVLIHRHFVESAGHASS